MAEWPTTTTSISSLPPEVLEKIFCMLDVADKCRCARVCVDWYNATCSKKVWRNASFTWTTDVDLSDSSSVRDSLIRRGIRRFAIKDCGEDAEVLDGVIERLPMMKSLNIHMWHLCDFNFCQPTLLSALSQLTELTFVVAAFISVKSVEALALNCPNLLSLEFRKVLTMECNVTDDWLKHIARNLNKLTRLVFGQHFGFSDSGVAHLTHHGPDTNYTLPRLQYLVLGGGCERLTDRAVDYLSVGQPYLKYLCFVLTNTISAFGVINLKSLKHLEELIVMDSQSRTPDSDMDSLASLCQLRVMRCKWLLGQAAELQQVANLDNLHVLEVRKLDLISIEPWRYLAQLPNLQQLSLYNCSINNASIKALADSGSRVVKLDVVGEYKVKVSDECLLNISRLSHLRELSLFRCRFIRGSGLRHLANGVANITHLKLGDYNNTVFSSALVHIERMNHLRHLTWYTGKRCDFLEDRINGYKLNHSDVHVQLIYLGIDECILENELPHLSFR